jgi:AbrB family looped-hinge helix DNA binding protein
MTSKGRTTLPREVRSILGVKPGDTVEFKFKDGKVLLKKAILPIEIEKQIQDG